MTDEHPSFVGLDGPYKHHTVNHSAGEYVRHYTLHTNSIESVWALLKRQIVGIHHWVSPKHLSRYATEMTWRYSRRDMRVTGKRSAAGPGGHAASATGASGAQCQGRSSARRRAGWSAMRVSTSAR